MNNQQIAAQKIGEALDNLLSAKGHLLRVRDPQHVRLDKKGDEKSQCMVKFFLNTPNR